MVDASGSACIRMRMPRALDPGPTAAGMYLYAPQLN